MQLQFSFRWKGFFLAWISWSKNGFNHALASSVLYYNEVGKLSCISH